MNKSVLLPSLLRTSSGTWSDSSSNNFSGCSEIQKLEHNYKNPKYSNYTYTILFNQHLQCYI